MELILFKTEEDLIRDGIERLEKTELHVSGSSGKVARLLLNIVNSILGDESGVYETLRINHLNAFLSTASGDSLDAIGRLLNVVRSVEDDDESYRYNISQATVSLAKCNETSVRLAALSVDGVQDVLFKEFTYGAGSFSVYILTEYAIPPEDIIIDVRNQLFEAKAYGIRYDVLTPLIKDVKMNVSLTFHEQALDVDKEIIEGNTKSLIVSYINSLNLGDILDVFYLKYIIINSDELIRDVVITSIRINDELVFVNNQKSKWNERFLMSSVDSSIIVQGD